MSTIHLKRPGSYKSRAGAKVVHDRKGRAVNVWVKRRKIILEEQVSTITFASPGENPTSDNIPASFSFTDTSSQTLGSTQTSNSITVLDIGSDAHPGFNVFTTDANGTLPGLYRINGGQWQVGNGVASLNDTIEVQHTASSNNGTQVNTTLLFPDGSVSDTFTSTTVSASTDVVIAFSDFTEAPRSGWSAANPEKGGVVTIWGRGFGTPGVRGSDYVTVGGVNLTADTDYPDTWCKRSNPIPWWDSITFQLNDSVPLGAQNITVTVGGVTSNSMPLTVNTNGIYFVDVNYGSAGTGTLTDPWSDPADWCNAMNAGDTCYFRGGEYDQLYLSGKAVFWLTSDYSSGTAGNNIQWASYPGEIAHINNLTNGNITTFERGIDCDNNYMTFSKFKVSALTICGQINNYGRFVSNDCMGHQQHKAGEGMINAVGQKPIIYGNTTHGAITNNKQDHTIYLSGCQDIEGGEIAFNWSYDNVIDRGPAYVENHQADRCGAGEYMQTNHWYSNVLEGGPSGGLPCRLFGIYQLSWDSGDPSIPICYFYNNIIYGGGQGTTHPSSYHYDGGAWFFNNTFIEDNGLGMLISNDVGDMSIKNNVWTQASGNSVAIIQNDVSAALLDVDYNAYWNGPASGLDSNAVTADPEITFNSSSYDLVTIGSTSSLKSAGTTDINVGLVVTKDFYMKTRTGTMDIGAINIED